MNARRHLAAGAVVALAWTSSAAYVVQPGDVLSVIAQRHGTSVGALAEHNGIRDLDHIRAGQVLEIPVLDRDAVGELIATVASEHGWSPAFVQALAWQESGWQQDRVSSAGAIGIMQVMSDTGRFVSHHLVGRELDLHDPHDNVVAGVVFLQHLWELTDGDPELTLAGYYQGLRSVRENGTFADTDRYVANVLALRDRFR
ncbi:lytic transglycosylase domain-containing protein [Egicoccus sp. AB-alg2]|uniref:lytic transglycosylase domain-containing protein n=1 Tax=Egicoccus sp. AB-alg2 TaxID=3242693 RepID=UPI00359D6911